MKVNTVVCDICGETVYNHAHHQYRIKKRFWETYVLWERMDLCEECWSELEKYILEKKSEGNEKCKSCCNYHSHNGVCDICHTRKPFGCYNAKPEKSEDKE